MNKKRILVIGDVMLDTYMTCDVDRVSPEAPVVVAKFCGTRDFPGGAANVAQCVNSFGHDVVLVGAYCPEDDAGKMLVKTLNKSVQLENISNGICRTINKVRITSNNKQLLRLDYEDQFGNISLNNSTVFQAIQEFDGIILSDYNKGVNITFPEIINKANEANIPVFVDSKVHDLNIYAGSFLIKPNLKEFLEICAFEKIILTSETVLNNHDNVLNKVLGDLCLKYNIDHFVVTLGASGAYWYSAKDNDLLFAPADRVDVFDVAGAGDVFLSYIADAILDKLDPSLGLKRAVFASSLSVTKPGTYCVKPEELTSDESAVVFTNGCFDILHVGHLEYLEKSRKLGSKLIVGLNSDRSVRKLKGADRPINDQECRKKMLESLSCVDEVIIFDDDTPLNLIKTISPDILTKGSDYKISDIVGADFVLASGGKVIAIPLVSDYSSSSIINRIKHG